MYVPAGNIEPLKCICDIKPSVPYVFSEGTGCDYKGITDTNTVPFNPIQEVNKNE